MTALEIDSLSAAARAAFQIPALRATATLRPSSSLYRVGGRFSYLRREPSGPRRYRAVTVAADAELEAVLRWAEPGAQAATLVRGLVDEGFDRADAEAFVDELCAEEILVHDLTPALTGPPALDGLVDSVQRGGEGSLAATLRMARDELAGLDRRPPGAAPATYETIAERLAGAGVAVDPARLFHVDLLKPGGATSLGPAPVAELIRGVELLHRLSFGEPAEALAVFAERFTARHGEREIPLVEALDPEDGLDFSGGASDEPMVWGPREAWLIGRLERAWSAGEREIELTEADLRELVVHDGTPLPGSLWAMATLAAGSSRSLAAGDFELLLGSVSGPSGTDLLNRFAQGDEELRGRIAAHLRAEEARRPDAIFVEIVHEPEDTIHSANVLMRPVLRDHELPYLARSGAPPGRQLAITDLMISVVRGRIILRSRAHQAEVIPRLGTAHNFSAPGNLPIYRFLCTLQYQGTVGGLAWSWGPAFEHARFLPRVRSGRLVLSLARWRVSAGPGCDAHALVQRERERLGWPRWLTVQDEVARDRILTVDLDNALSVDSLTHLLARRGTATLVEMWPSPDRLCAHGPQGAFVHELIVPFLSGSRAPEPPPRPRSAAIQSFAPGSEWLHVKLLANPARIEELLRTLVAPVVEAVTGLGAAYRWFFIRYDEPEWHVRLRFHGSPARLHDEVLPRIERAALARSPQPIWRIQIEPYEREVDRYGGDEGIVVAEEIFWRDSVAALALVEALGADADVDVAAHRHAALFRGVDALLDDLGYDLAGKRDLVSRIAADWNGGLDVTEARRLGVRFRHERAALEAALGLAAAEGNDRITRALRSRSTHMRPLAARLRELDAAGALTRPRSDIVASLLHMHLNRVAIRMPRAEEGAIYDLLARVYRGQCARRSAAP